MKRGLIRQFCVFVWVCVGGMAEASPRPHLRSNLARTVYDRMMSDERLRNMDLSKMYEVDQLALEDEVRLSFLQLSCDEDTRHFLDDCFEQSEWLFTQVWHAVAKSFLGFFMTQTSVNGLLGRGRMFVFSEDQAKLLLSGKPHHHQPRPDEGEDEAAEVKWKDERLGSNDPTSRADGVCYERSESLSRDSPPQGRAEGKSRDDEEERIGVEPSFWLGERLLDLGAGDGHVTKVLSAGARHVDVTEASPVMRKRLRDLGYRVLDTWQWMNETEGVQYDVITALNLLDRCDTPKTLLGHIRQKLVDDGTLVVALVLPFCPYVETGSADNMPSENLGVSGSTTEEQVNSLATEVFPSLGFKVHKWTRLPYLCEGDLDQAFYWLSDVVLVLKKENSSLSGKDQAGKVIREEGVNDNKIEL